MAQEPETIQRQVLPILIGPEERLRVAMARQ
jgi:hypothetical protein